MTKKNPSCLNTAVTVTLCVLGIVVAITGFSVFAANLEPSMPEAPKNAGSLGAEHEHALILVAIFNKKLDFSHPAYQLRSSWIHFENGNGDIIHRHAPEVTLGYLFDTLRIKLTDNCIIIPYGKKFCTNDQYSLKFYINHDKVFEIRNYVIQNGDRMLVSYGNESDSQIQKQLEELDSTNLFK